VRCKSASLKKFYHHIAYLFSANTLAIVVPFFFAPLLTRVYAAEEFGAYAQLTAYASLMSIFATGALEYAILLPKNKQTAIFLLHAAQLLAIILSFFSFILVVILFLSIQNFSSIYLLIPLYGIIISSQKIWNYWQNRHENYRLMAAAHSTRAILMSGLQLSLGNIASKGLGLILGDILAQMVKFSLLVKSHTGEVFRSAIRLKKMLAAVKTYKEFPLLAMPSEFLNFLSVQLPIFAFIFFFGDKAAGLYFLPHKILSTPLNALGNAISQVYYKTLSKHNNDFENIQNISEKIYKKLFISGIWGFGFILFFGEKLFAFVFGDRWQLSGLFASYLSPWLFMVYVFSPISIIFTAINKLKISLLMNLSLLVLRSGALLIGSLYLVSLEKTVLLYGLTSFAYWIVLAIYIMRFTGLQNRKIIIYSLKHLIISGTAILLLSRII